MLEVLLIRNVNKMDKTLEASAILPVWWIMDCLADIVLIAEENSLIMYNVIFTQNEKFDLYI